MFKFKKVISMVLMVSLLFLVAMPTFAASDKVSEDKSSVELTMPVEEITDSQIDASKVQEVLDSYVKDGSLTQDYADKVMEIVNNSTSNSSRGSDTNSYTNSSTDAVIMLVPTGGTHYELIFNKEGWNIIKEVINIGGGSATIGLGIAALAGATVTGPIAAIIGGVVVVSNAWVNLQFALGNEYAVLNIS